MNKRQAKKAFKKKYGYNPGQLEKNIKSIDRAPVALEIIKECFKDMHDSYNRMVQECLKIIQSHF